MPYLRGEEGRTDGCLFCVAPQVGDAEVHIVCRGELCYAILNRYPYNNGHLMVVPYAHVATLEDLDAETLAELMALTQRSLRVLREAYAPQGFNVGVNIGEVAGAGMAAHVHLHIVPRQQLHVYRGRDARDPRVAGPDLRAVATAVRIGRLRVASHGAHVVKGGWVVGGGPI